MRKIYTGKFLESDHWLGLEGDGRISHLKFLLDFVHPAGKALNNIIAETNSLWCRGQHGILYSDQRDIK